MSNISIKRVNIVKVTILFGEGGGTFSDGKATTLINDYRCRYVLESLVKHGAQSEILYINKPHVGTDIVQEHERRDYFFRWSN